MVPAGLAALLVLGAVVLGGCVEGTQIIKDITPAQAMEKINEEASNPDFVILDVRTPEEFADGHIENAENIDFYASDFQSQLKGLDRSKTYVVYCRSGRRSEGARDMMKDLGFSEVYNVLGGIVDWTDQGLPTVE
jgi:rhodanese-related sulfurtransferase